jgi:hypothetical protein
MMQMRKYKIAAVLRASDSEMDDLKFVSEYANQSILSKIKHCVVMLHLRGSDMDRDDAIEYITQQKHLWEEIKQNQHHINEHRRSESEAVSMMDHDVVERHRKCGLMLNIVSITQCLGFASCFDLTRLDMDYCESIAKQNADIIRKRLSWILSISVIFDDDIYDRIGKIMKQTIGSRLIREHGSIWIEPSKKVSFILDRYTDARYRYRAASKRISCIESVEVSNQ